MATAINRYGASLKDNFWVLLFVLIPDIILVSLLKNNIAYIDGVKNLRGRTLVGLDLRSSAALIIAALTSNSISYVYGLEHLDRGYENFELKLSGLGFNIKRQKTNNINIILENDSNLNKKDISEIKAA